MNAQKRESHDKASCSSRPSLCGTLFGKPFESSISCKSTAAAPGLSQNIYVFLGHVYAAEALCHLNQPKGAVEQLSLCFSDGINVECPYSDKDRERWRVKKAEGEELNGSETSKNSSMEESQGIFFLGPEEARGILYANLASTYAMYVR